jgi:F0F1-type ATP synthase membrane subunit c/vacuolar-type H+-ATPase subunit K
VGRHTEFIPLLVLALSQSQRRQTLFQTLITSLLLEAVVVLNVVVAVVLVVW